jgi:hypothetical protein
MEQLSVFLSSGYVIYLNFISWTACQETRRERLGRVAGALPQVRGKINLNLHYFFTRLARLGSTATSTARPSDQLTGIWREFCCCRRSWSSTWHWATHRHVSNVRLVLRSFFALGPVWRFLWPLPFISPFNTQQCILSFYTQHHCYVFLKTLYPGGIWTRDFLFLRRMRCPLCATPPGPVWRLLKYVRQIFEKVDFDSNYRFLGSALLRPEIGPNRR